jgi:hypothetical protein
MIHIHDQIDASQIWGGNELTLNTPFLEDIFVITQEDIHFFIPSLDSPKIHLFPPRWIRHIVFSFSMVKSKTL